MAGLVEKDVEYAIKNLILSADNDFLTITNDFQSDGIVRFNKKPMSILEFKIKRNFENEKTMTQVCCQAMCYYCKLIEKEEIDYNKPFYIVVGDENEIAVINLHKFPGSWLRNKKWTEVAPSRAWKEQDLFELTESMLKVEKPIYYKYNDTSELAFGFYLLFKNIL